MITTLRDRSDRYDPGDGFGPMPRIVPGKHLVTAILEVTAPGARLPVGTRCVYVTHKACIATVEILEPNLGERRVAQVEAWALDFALLNIDTLDLDYQNFLEGYTLGVTASQNDQEIGTKKTSGPPKTWFDRGVREGFADRERATELAGRGYVDSWVLSELRAFARAWFRALPSERIPLGPWQPRRGRP